MTDDCGLAIFPEMLDANQSGKLTLTCMAQTDIITFAMSVALRQAFARLRVGAPLAASLASFSSRCTPPAPTLSCTVRGHQSQTPAKKAFSKSVKPPAKEEDDGAKADDDSTDASVSAKQNPVLVPTQVYPSLSFFQHIGLTLLFSDLA